MQEADWDKIAGNYHEEVICPLLGEVENPLYDELKNIKCKKQKSVAEFGCGLFYLGETLSKNFGKVHASDFSGEMVRRAKEKAEAFDNVTIKKEDIRKIKYKDEFDVVISVNSIIMPSYEDIKISFQNEHACLKPDGELLMILPSMEGVLYHGLLLLYEQLEKHDEPIARRVAKTKFEKKKYDLFLGHYKEGKNKQKFYYKHEIRYLLTKAGFRDIEIKKVKYSWNYDMSAFQPFPGEPRMWDWFVKARK